MSRLERIRMIHQGLIIPGKGRSGILVAFLEGTLATKEPLDGLLLAEDARPSLEREHGP